MSEAMSEGMDHGMTIACFESTAGRVLEADSDELTHLWCLSQCGDRLPL